MEELKQRITDLEAELLLYVNFLISILIS